MNEVMIPMNITASSIDIKAIKFHKLYTHNSVLKRLDPKKLPAGTISTIVAAGKSVNLDRFQNFKSKGRSFKFIVHNYDDLLGAIVWTCYGIGRISTYRKLDDKFAVTLQCGATVYCNPSKLVRISDTSDLSNISTPSMTPAVVSSTSVVNGGGSPSSTAGNIVVGSHQSSTIGSHLS